MSGRERNSPRPLVAVLSSGALTGLVVALWVGFAPTSVGGDYSYAVVRGNSMEPGLHNGDIVLLRRDSEYGLGDVVAYRDPQLGPVLHRIVARQGDRFTLRGDNRDTIDAYQPLPSDVLGRFAGAWPGGLRIILTVTAWPTLLLLAGAFVAFGFSRQLSGAHAASGPVFVTRAQRRRFRLSAGRSAMRGPR